MTSGVERWTVHVCLARIFLFAPFMTVASVIPLIQEAWGIGATGSGAVVTSFTVGYALSLFGFSWIADHIGAKRATLVSAAASAAGALLFGLFARDWLTAFVLYGLVGLAQGGVYTPLVMLFAQRSHPESRGRNMGMLIASTSVGYAFSLAICALVLSFADYRTVFLVTGFLPAIGAATLWLALRDVENVVVERTTKLRLSRATFGGRDARLLTIGYTGHCWELLGSWAWMPSLIAAALVLSGDDLTDASRYSAWSTSAMHLTGAAAAFTMGALSDRLGRRTVLLGVAAAGTALSFLIGWLVIIPAAILIAIAVAYAFITIGDSPVLTTATTEVTEPGYMGAVLAIRSLLGFGAGALAPLAAGVMFDAGAAAGLAPAVVWGLTFCVLGLGGLVAAVSAARLKIDN